MKDETMLWLDYANENLKSAQVLLESHLYNVALQNIQQSIEKYLKALLVEKGIGLQKTHNISILAAKLESAGYAIGIEDDIIDLIDSIYLTSKYPMGSILPDFHPDEALCELLLENAREIKQIVQDHL
jgi:HEPN domain-containing protein